MDELLPIQYTIPPSISVKTRRHKREKKKPMPDAIPQDVVLQIIETGTEVIKNAYNRNKVIVALCLMYLTGGRINEVKQIRPSDISAPTSSDGKTPDTLYIDMVTEKNRNIKRRQIPIFLNPIERKMMSYVLKFIAEEQIDPLKPILEKLNERVGRRYIKRIQIPIRATDPKTGNPINITLGIYPHYFRHCRATHFVQLYHLNTFQLVKVMGWTDARPAMIYVHLDSSDVADTMKREYNKRVEIDGNNTNTEQTS